MTEKYLVVEIGSCSGQLRDVPDCYDPLIRDTRVLTLNLTSKYFCLENISFIAKKCRNLNIQCIDMGMVSATPACNNFYFFSLIRSG